MKMVTLIIRPPGMLCKYRVFRSAACCSIEPCSLRLYAACEKGSGKKDCRYGKATNAHQQPYSGRVNPTRKVCATIATHQTAQDHDCCLRPQDAANIQEDQYRNAIDTRT